MCYVAIVEGFLLQELQVKEEPRPSDLAITLNDGDLNDDYVCFE